MDNNITTDIIISIEEYNKPLPKKILGCKSMHSKDNHPTKLTLLGTKKKRPIDHSASYSKAKGKSKSINSKPRKEEVINKNKDNQKCKANNIIPTSILKTNENKPKQATVSYFRLTPFKYIDINETISKSELEISDILLSIIEVSLNNSLYNITYSNTTKCFWEQVLRNKILGKIFESYKPETLRKYWKTMRVTSIEKVYHVINSNRELINSMLKIKLKTLITIICQYVQCSKPKESFENYCLGSKKHMKNKLNNEEILKQFYYKDQKVLCQISQKDIEMFDAFDKIVNEFKNVFLNIYEESIRNELVNNSMNIEKSYQSLIQKQQYNE